MLGLRTAVRILPPHTSTTLPLLPRRYMTTNSPYPFRRQPATVKFPRSSYRRTQQSLYSTVVVHDKPRSRFRRTLSFFVIASLSFLGGAYYSINHSPPLLSIFLMGSHQPTDSETLTLYTPPDDFSREVDEHIKNSPLAVSLRNDPTWTEARFHMKIPESVKQHNLTGGTLAGPGMIVVPPYFFNKKDGSEMVQILYVGGDVCGHPGIVHGGFIATLMDEGLARCAFAAMTNKVGVTANLNINYRKPTMAGQFLVLRAQTTKVEGRKAWAKGWIEALEDGGEGGRFVEAEALFIEPKNAKIMKSIYKIAT